MIFLCRFLCIEFLIPIIQISLFCLCIGRQPYDLNIGVVNNETIYNSTFNASLQYIRQLDNHTFNLVKTVSTGHSTWATFLMILFNYLKKYLNWSDAYNSVHEGKLWGFLDISRNFTQDTSNKLVLVTLSVDMSI